MEAGVCSPDAHGSGLSGVLDPLRYDGQTDHPAEVAGILHAMMPANVRVLDVGCGTGSVTLIANRDRGNDVVAIEPDSERARVARSRDISVVEGVLDDAFIAAHELFDVVLSSDVIEHVAAPADFIRQMAKAMKPNGYLLVSVPNVAHWTVRLRLLAGQFDYQESGIMDTTHLRWFTDKTIRNLLKGVGFDIVEVRQTAGVEQRVYSRGKLRHIPVVMREPMIRYAALTGC